MEKLERWSGRIGYLIVCSVIIGLIPFLTYPKCESFHGFCPKHGLMLVPVFLCLVEIVLCFILLVNDLKEIRRDARENPEIYEQARKNTLGIGLSPRGGISFGLEVARLKEERRKKIKELYPQDTQNPGSR